MPTSCEPQPANNLYSLLISKIIGYIWLPTEKNGVAAMVDRRKRLALTLSPETHSAISRIARAQGRTMVSVVNDFLDEVQPYLTPRGATLEVCMSFPLSWINSIPNWVTIPIHLVLFLWLQPQKRSIRV